MPNIYEELLCLKMWKSFVAEFVGTFILIFLGVPSCLGREWDKIDSPQLVSISLAFGMTVTTVVWCIGHVSGAHINPAVSIALVMSKKVSVGKAFFYIIAQLLGALTSGEVLYVITPKDARETLCITQLGPNVQLYQAVIVETIITFVLVLTVLATFDSRKKEYAASAPLAIGLSVTACQFGFIKYTGASMNPARSFGVAVVTNVWTNHWVYWLGPILGGLIASLMYETIFAEDASLKNLCCFNIIKKGSEEITQPSVDSK